MSEQELPPFSGHTVSCPKCGHDHAWTQYHDGRVIAWSRRKHAAGEHLDRGCTRCGYGWDEAVVQGRP